MTATTGKVLLAASNKTKPEALTEVEISAGRTTIRPADLTKARHAILGTIKTRIRTAALATKTGAGLATVQTVKTTTKTTTKETATQADSEAASLFVAAVVWDATGVGINAPRAVSRPARALCRSRYVVRLASEIGPHVTYSPAASRAAVGSATGRRRL